MFDIGMPEFMVIAVVALVVLGPERLPEVMRKVGRAYRQLREMSSQLTSEFQRQLEEGMRDVEEVSATISSAWQDATSTDASTAGPPPRLLHLPAPLQAPQTPAGAGPWALAAWQRDAAADLEPQPAAYLHSPCALPRRLPASEPAFDDLDAAGGPSLMGPAPTDEELAELYGLPADLPLPARDGSSAAPPSQAPASLVEAVPATANGTRAPGTRSADATGVPAAPERVSVAAALGAGGNGRAARAPASARELTVVELYRAGGVTLEKAAEFLAMTPEAFAALALQPASGAKP